MGSKKSSTPEAPKVPTYDEQMQSYINSIPQLAEAQLQAIQQYGGQTALAQQQAYEQVSPYQAALPEDLAKMASEGMTGDLPPELQEQYLSNIRANLGTNAGSQIGATALAREMFNAGEQRRGQYQNLALSLAGRTPVFQSQGYDTFMSPSSSLTAQQNLTTQAMNLYKTNLTNQPEQSNPWGGALSGAATGAKAGSAFGPWGTVIGGVGGGAMGYFTNS
jgi:hypothetical protein